MINKEKVIVITLNYNQNDYTLACINSLLNSNYDNFQVFLIDNGSTKQNYLTLKKQLPKDDRILLSRLEENRGYVGGINFGLQEVKKLSPDYFLIMNNDTIIDQKAIIHLVEACKKFEDKAIVSGKVYYYDEKNLLQTVGYQYVNKKNLKKIKLGNKEKDIGQYETMEERDMLDDIFWLMPNKIVSEIGLYSEWFGFGAEQADYAMKAKKANYKLIYTPYAKLWHKENATVGHKIRTPYKAFWSIQGQLMFKWLYLPKRYFLKYYLRAFIEVFAAVFYDFISIFNPKVEKRMAKSKIFALLRFHLWIFIKMSHYRFIPKFIK